MPPAPNLRTPESPPVSTSQGRDARVEMKIPRASGLAAGKREHGQAFAAQASHGHAVKHRLPASTPGSASVLPAPAARFAGPSLPAADVLLPLPRRGLLLPQELGKPFLFCFELKPVGRSLLSTVGWALQASPWVSLSSPSV